MDRVMMFYNRLNLWRFHENEVNAVFVVLQDQHLSVNSPVDSSGIQE